MHFRIPKGNERLLRHQAKMQRKHEEAFMNEPCIWLKPSMGSLNEPKYKKPLWLWIHSQTMHKMFVAMEKQHPDWKARQDKIRDNLMNPNVDIKQVITDSIALRKRPI